MEAPTTTISPWRLMTTPSRPFRAGSFSHVTPNRRNSPPAERSKSCHSRSSLRLERVPIRLKQGRALDSLFGRIFCGKPVSTFPENALCLECRRRQESALLVSALLNFRRRVAFPTHIKSAEQERHVSEDPYAVLGVKPEATQDEIRTAYRALAKKLHPDLNPGDKQAEEKFKQVAVAYDLLGDPEKRGRFDRGEIDASGAERPRERYYRDFHGAGAEEHHYSSSGGFADFVDDDDILAEMLRRGGGRTRMRIRGQDVHYRLPVEFLEAVNGATKRITMPDGATLDVAIPAGTRDQQVLRLRGKGGPGIGGAPAGDALVTIEVELHDLFTRKDDDIHLELPVSLPEAVFGGKIDVPTPSGPVRMTVPKGANTGTVLRLKGKGAPRGDKSHGDEYVTLNIVLPQQLDPEIEEFARRWQAGQSQNPRRHLRLE